MGLLNIRNQNLSLNRQKNIGFPADNQRRLSDQELERLHKKVADLHQDSQYFNNLDSLGSSLAVRDGKLEVTDYYQYQRSFDWLNQATQADKETAKGIMADLAEMTRPQDSPLFPEQFDPYDYVRSKTYHQDFFLRKMTDNSAEIESMLSNEEKIAYLAQRVPNLPTYMESHTYANGNGNATGAYLLDFASGFVESNSDDIKQIMSELQRLSEYQTDNPDDMGAQAQSQTLFLLLQHKIQKRAELLELVSNMLQAIQNTLMTSVNNMRP